MRFLLIDDHPIVRDALKQLLVQLYAGATIAEASTAREAMETLPQKRWDVVFLDISLPDRSGLDLVRDLQSVAPQVPVLVFSGMREEEFGERVLKSGAWGFLPKCSTMGEVQTAVQRVRSGKKYISADLAAKLMESAIHPTPETAHEALSARELEVLRQLGAGHSVSEIADRLNLSVKTVSTYRARMLDKLGLKNTAGLIRYVVMHGLE